MAPPVTTPAKPEGAKGTQFPLWTSIPPTTRKVTMAPILIATITLLAPADSRTPRTSSKVSTNTIRNPGRLKYAPVQWPPAQTGMDHLSARCIPKASSCALVYPLKPTATATLLTTYSRIRSQPMIQAKISPRVAYTYSYATLGEIFAWTIGWDQIRENVRDNVARSEEIKLERQAAHGHGLT